MWSYLEHISLLLEGVTRTLQHLSPDQAFKAKHRLTTQSLRRKHGRIAKPITTAKNILFVTDEKGEIAPGILLYIMDGVLPMLNVKTTIINCSHVFNPLYVSYMLRLFILNIFIPLINQVTKLQRIQQLK